MPALPGPYGMLIDQIETDLRQTLKLQEQLKVSVLRLLLAEIHNRKIEKQAELTDEDVIGVIKKEAKKRREAIEAYRQGRREDLVQKEKAELWILNKYLPQPMSPEELEKIVKEAIKERGAKGVKDFGKVMGVVMGKVKGRADGGGVTRVVRELLKN